MKKFIFNSMLVGGLMMASCSDDVMEAPVQEDVRQEYSKNFIERFGPVSRNASWTAAELVTIQVNGVAGKDVKVYANINDVYRLAGTFENVSDGQSLTFTTYKNITDFIATSGSTVRKVVNGVADFSSLTRTYNPNLKSEVATLTDYIPFNYLGFNNCLRRTKANNKNGKLGFFEDFELLEEEEMTIYPIYWETDPDYAHKLYVCWTDETGKEHEEFVYQTRSGDDIRVDYAQNFNYINFDNAEVVDHSKEKAYSEKGNTKPAAVWSRGFTVNLPSNTAVSLRLDVYDNLKCEGDPIYQWSTVADKNENGEVHALVQNPNDNQLGKGAPAVDYMVLNFEEDPLIYDNKKIASDFDDVVFLIGKGTRVKAEDPQTWILAVEDLGTTNDYDFNDVVLSVSHSTNSPTAEITLLAAGGTLEAHLYYKDQPVSDPEQGITSEVHSWLGKSATANGRYPMINTMVDDAWIQGGTVEWPVDEGFTMAAYTTNTPAEMGDFTIRVNGWEENTAPVKITAPERGSVPQMICLDEAFYWPKEYASINDAYPNFTDWVKEGDNFFWGNNYPNAGWLEVKNLDYIWDGTSSAYN